MQPDAEHQQDHADLGELAGQVLVGDEAGRERSDRDAGEQIADQGRDPEAVGDRAEQPGEPERDDDGRDQRRVMRHQPASAGAAAIAAAGAAASGRVIMPTSRASSTIVWPISCSPMITLVAP